MYHEMFDITTPVSAVLNQFHHLEQEDLFVSMTSLIVHLIDQVQWGLLSGAEAIDTGRLILEKCLGLSEMERTDKEVERSHKREVEQLQELYVQCIAENIARTISATKGEVKK